MLSQLPIIFSGWPRYMEGPRTSHACSRWNYRIALLPQSRAEADDQWVALLKIMSLDEHFRERHGR